MKAGDEVVDQLRDGSVLADHNEARRDSDASIFPETVCLIVVTVECFEGSLELWWEAERIEFAAFSAPFLWHFRPDVFPQVAEHGHLFPGDVVGHGDARQFNNAALDGIHEREVAHRPREQCPFGIPRAAEEERGGRQIDDTRTAKLSVYRLNACTPNSRSPRDFIVSSLFV